MATTNMKRIVANALADYIAANVSGLAGKVSAVAAGPETTKPCLAVKVIADNFQFVPMQEDEVYEADPDDGKIITDVGAWEGGFTIELYTATPAEREQYEQAIMDLFMVEEFAPGTLFVTLGAVTIGGYVSLYQPEMKFRLEGESWLDEMAFEGKRYCFLDVSMDFPALITRDAHDLDISLFMHPDTEATITDASQVDDDYQVVIDEDGNTTPVEDPTP